MDLNHPLAYQLQDSLRLNEGLCKNLSGSGLMFSTEIALDPDTVIDVTMPSSDDKLVPPLRALMKVVRCQRKAPRLFEISGMFLGNR